jgi:hypothetical protein
MNKFIGICTAALAYLLLPVAMVAVAFSEAKEYVHTCVEELL